MATQKQSKAPDPSPILNGPYTEPQRHYATAPDGSLDYENPCLGRRVFAPTTPQVPLGKQRQGSEHGGVQGSRHSGVLRAKSVGKTK